MAAELSDILGVGGERCETFRELRKRRKLPFLVQYEHRDTNLAALIFGKVPQPSSHPYDLLYFYYT
jgi:hypothetical protein